MPELPALHLVIYSEILLYSGGRETWLSYFLPRVAQSKRFRSVTVYHMEPSKPEAALPLHLDLESEGAPVHFVSSGRTIHGERSGPAARLPGSVGAALRFGTFLRAVLLGLRREAHPGDLLLAVGVHGEAPPALLGWLAARGKLRLVTWVREAPSLMELVRKRRGRGAEAALKLLRRGVLGASSRIVTSGVDMADLYRDHFPKLAGRVSAVPNAVDLESYAGIPLPDPSDTPIRIAYVGRFIPEKGFLEFLEAAERCQDEPRLAFFACGHAIDGLPTPPQNVELRAPVPQEQVREVLAEAHGVVFLNEGRLSAGLSHSLLEALAAARVIVAWDNTCHRQVLSGENSVLVAEHDVAGLEAAFRRLLSLPPETFVTLATKARAKAAEYSHEAHVERFLNQVVDPLLGG